MPYFAEKDGSGRVLRVIVAAAIAWPQSRLGGTWVETEIANPQQQYAGPGMFDSVTIAPRRFIPPWRQPVGSEDAWPNGAWCWHNGRAWRSLQAANVFEPGVASWREMLVEWPEYVQPTGAQDAYQVGEKITENGARYVCLADATVWPPSVVPSAWEWVGGAEPTAMPGPEPIEEWPAWKPWTGINADLYQVGAKVTHNGLRWIANIGNNHWEPGQFGWTQQP